MAITAGDIINGYRLIESIADGGMGSVWKAKHPNLERLVAIKFIKPELLSADTVRQLFLEEVRHLSQLHAPQVVQVLDSGLTESNAPFMVTEYLPGVDLATHLDVHGALSPETVCRIGIEVLKALSEAHALGIIHGDLKPSNIFLMEVQGQKLPVVKVLDFGVACLMEEGGDEESTLGSRIVRGSLQYMSPEQVTLGNLTFASDLYTLGATLYRLLTNRYVFEGESQELVRQKLSEKAPSVASKTPDGSCPSALDDLVSSCLERRSEDRPSSAQALRKRLEYIQSQLSSGARHVADTTAVDVSVPDWLQSGFSQTGTQQAKSDASPPNDLALDPVHSSAQRPVLTLDDPSDVTPLLEPPRKIEPHRNELTSDASRTVEQAAPSIAQLKTGNGGEHFSSETTESQPFTSENRRPARKAKSKYFAVMGVVALALISIAIGRWSEAPKPDKPKVKPRSEMEETAARLQEAKALLAKLEKNPPRTSKPRVEHSKVQSGRDIVLSLPPGKVGQFLNANTKSRLCPQMVMSCRVPRNLNVEVRAPNHTPRVFSSHELKAHPTELKSFRLRKRAPKKNKK